MKNWSLPRTVQCAKCPWRKDTNPHDIPNGYSEEKHRNLKDTIAKPSDLSALLSRSIRIMACHEDHNSHCIGWLMNQLGSGNNIPLRIQMLSCSNRDKIKLIGKQHACFEDTLPVRGERK